MFGLVITEEQIKTIYTFEEDQNLDKNSLSLAVNTCRRWVSLIHAGHCMQYEFLDKSIVK